MAFYAALSDAGKLVAPKDGMKLKYSKVFTNVGNAYDNTTGESPRRQVTSPSIT